MTAADACHTAVYAARPYCHWKDGLEARIFSGVGRWFAAQNFVRIKYPDTIAILVIPRIVVD
jgi:hypothetical protein